MNRSLRMLLLGCVGMLLSAPLGCASNPREGYAAANLYPAQFRSVSATIFRNRSYIRGIEKHLMEALTKELESTTPYSLASEVSADTVLQGTITDARLLELSKDPTTGLANEMMFEVTANFEWIDMRTGKKIVAQNGIKASALFVPSAPAREPIELAQFAVAEDMARDIVAAMQTEW